MKEDLELKPQKVKTRIRLLKATLYKDHMVYIRMIGTDLFIYDLVFNNQIYSGNMVITPNEGRNHLTMKQRQQACALVYTGAMTTIDYLLGETVDDKTKEIVETFEETRDLVETPKDGKER